MKCLVCNSDMNKMFKKLVRLYGDEKSFYLCSNEQCGHISVNIVAEENIHFHTHDFRERFTYTEKDLSGDQITELFHEHMRPIVHKRIEFLTPYFDSSYVFFDIGSGSGTFAMELKDKVKRVDCLEVDQRLVDDIEKMGFRVYRKPFEQCEFKKKYSFITAWHVFEHITDGNQFLIKCKEILNDDGKIAIEVPYERSLKRKYDGHCHHYNENSLKMMMEKHGFDIVAYQLGLQDRSHVIVGQKRR